MASVFVLVNVEGREVCLHLPDSKFTTLELEFEKFCQEDRCLKRRALKYMPIYQVHNEFFGKLLELPRSQPIRDKEIIHIGWSELHDDGLSSDNLNRSPGMTFQKQGQPIETSLSKRDGFLPPADSESPLLSSALPSGSRIPSTSSMALRCSLKLGEITNKILVGAQKETLTVPTESMKGMPSTDKNSRQSKSETSKTSSPTETPGPSTSQHDPDLTDKIDLSNSLSESESESESGSENEQLDFSELQEYFDEEHWKSLSKAEKKAYHRKFTRHEQLRGRGIIKTPFPKQSAQTKQHQRAEKKKKPRHFSSKDKENRDDNSDMDDSFTVDSPYIPEGEEEVNNESSDDSQPPAKKSKPTPQKRKKGPHPKQTRRVYGQVLTAKNALPKFSALAEASLKTDEPDMRLVLLEIRAHVNGILKDHLPTRAQYRLLAHALIKKYPTLADPDDPEGYENVKAKISASLREKRKNEKRKLEKEKKKLEALNKTNSSEQLNIKIVPNQTEEEKADAELRDIQDVFSSTPHIQLLIQKTRDIRYRLFEAAASKTDIEEKRDAAKAVWNAYPFYKNTKLMVFEYSLMIKTNVLTMKENFLNHMNKLKLFYKLTEEATVCEEIEMLIKVFNDITPTQCRNPDKITPPIQMMDVIDAQGPEHVATSHSFHSPCVLVVTEFNEDGVLVASKAFLKMYDMVISEAVKPSAFEVAAQLLAPYFIQEIGYPSAYKSFLRLVELMLQDSLSLNTMRTRAHDTYTKFMRKKGLAQTAKV